MTRSIALLLLLGITGAYLLVAFSPIKWTLGRTSQEIASWFSLPLGNFARKYQVTAIGFACGFGRGWAQF
jgi:hypothetical protein